jgi:predicted DNA-binding transcriptional regulator AlpA
MSRIQTDQATVQRRGDQRQPLLVAAKDACQLAGVSPATWWRLRAADKIPAPVRLGGRVLWRVEELKAWIAAGCPAGQTWRTLRETVRR